MAPASASGPDPDGDDAFTKQSKLAERAARFNNKLPGNRYKELEELRAKERDAFLERGMITSGQTDLAEAVDLRGTCEDMCTPYEREFREYTREIHPFEATPQRRIDHAKAVAAYTRSDAGAGHGVAAILPSDLRTPSSLVRSLDYLIDNIMGQQPPPNPNAVHQPAPSPRRALGFSSGFIRDRTRAIRKEFALQSSWGHDEGIATFERIARWHIICLRELQEETGNNTDMHIDNAELGRCFTSLRQQYNDRREELGVDMPCANEPEFRAYMLIYDLASKSVSIATAELPQVILDHPLVQLAWQIRQAAQRNFDSQKEGSKLNAEYGANLITRFVRLLKQGQVPYLMSCLVEVRLRDMRRSAIRALTRSYAKLKTDPIRREETGEIAERKMVLMSTLDRLLGAEEQEMEATAWDDVEPVSRDPDDESAAVVQRFNIRVYHEPGDDKPMGALINLSAQYNDNKDAPFTRRWKLISDKLAMPYADVVNGNVGVGIGGAPAAQPAAAAPPPPPKPVSRPPVQLPRKAVPTQLGSWKPVSAQPTAPATSTGSAFAAKANGSAFQTGQSGVSAFGPGPSTTSAFANTFGKQQNGKPPVSAFNFKPETSTSASPFPPAKKDESKAAESAATPIAKVPNFFSKDPAPSPSTTPIAPPPPKLDLLKKDAEPIKQPAPLFSTPGIFDSVPKPAPTSDVGPSKRIPAFFPSTTPAAEPVVATQAPFPGFSSILPSPQRTPALVHSPPKQPPKPVTPSIKASWQYMRSLPSILADELIKKVVADLIQDNEPVLAQTVKQREVVAIYRQSKVDRKALVRREAESIFSELVEDQVRSVVFARWFYAMRARVIANEMARDWRAWAKRRVEGRQRLARQREQDRQQLKGIGLGRSYGYLDGESLATSRSRSARSGAPSIITLPERVVESEANFQETEAMRRKFWQSDSSLFKVIAGHVAPLIRPAPTEPEPLWETVLLTAGQSGLPAGEGASTWLSSKLLTPKSGPRVLDGVYYHANVGFHSCATDVQGFFPGTSSTGLYIFEAPLITLNTAERVRNMDDASDRLEAASGAVQQGSRYRSGLLILTWEIETLDEVVQRLGIERDIEQFEHVAAVSIHNPETFGALFARALKTVVPSDPRKSQVVLPLFSVADRLYAHYQELLRVADNLFAEFPTSTRLVPYALRAAYDLLSSARRAIDEQIVELGESDDSSYTPPSLPPFSVPSGNDSASVAAAVQEYMSQPELSSIGSVSLAFAELRDAATHDHPLPAPFHALMDELGGYVCTVLRDAELRLEQWFDVPHHLHAARRVQEAIIAQLGDASSQAIKSLAGEALVERARRATLLPSPPLKALSALETNVGNSVGVKRQREDDADPVKSKAARLAALMASAKAGLSASQTVMEAAQTPTGWRFR